VGRVRDIGGRNPLTLISGSARRRPRGRWDRSIAITVASGLVLLLVLGLIFSVAYGSQRITTSAGALHDADETLRSATIVRAQLALAGHMDAVDDFFGTNSSVQITDSLEEATTALVNLKEGIDLLNGAGLLNNEALAASVAFTTTANNAIELIATTSPEPASIQVPLTDSFERMTTALVEIRDERRATVAESDQLLGQIGNAARFFVAFLVPAAVILIYRELQRRQQRQAELETRLDAERQINLAQEQFIANASHELRTPLTSILGLSLMLGENQAVKEEAAASELVGIIVGESEELARMVEDLLTVARLDAGALHYTFEDIDVANELQDIADGAARGGMTVTVAGAPSTIRADRLRFRQIIRNLLSNARKYGGPDVRVTGHVDGRTYVCTVIDNGAGIPQELVPRLFERFIHQGHDTASRDSVGLGLSIVHSLALGMGGSVAYQQTEGESHFSLRLPLTPPHQPGDKPSSSRQPTSHVNA